MPRPTLAFVNATDASELPSIVATWSTVPFGQKSGLWNSERIKENLGYFSINT